jgi:hypothetical protein
MGSAMTEASSPEFVAHSRPGSVGLVVLVAVNISLIYLILTAFDSSLRVLSLGHLNLGRPSVSAGFFLMVCAALSMAATYWQFSRRLRPRIDVIVDQKGIAIHQLPWACGRLAWNEIGQVQFSYLNSFYIIGTPSRPGGKGRKLVLDTASIDKPIDQLIRVMVKHRPDLLPVPPK